MPKADSLKHPQQFYLTILFPQIVFIPSGKSNTQPAPPPSQFLPLWMLQSRSSWNILHAYKSASLQVVHHFIRQFAARFRFLQLTNQLFNQHCQFANLFPGLPFALKQGSAASVPSLSICFSYTIEMACKQIHFFRHYGRWKNGIGWRPFWRFISSRTLLPVIRFVFIKITNWLCFQRCQSNFE